MTENEVDAFQRLLVESYNKMDKFKLNGELQEKEIHENVHRV